MNYNIWLLIILFFGCKNIDETPNTDKFNAVKNSEPEGVIAFTSKRDGNFEIYTIDLDSNKLTRLTNHDDLDYYSSWTSDGEWLAFYSKRNGNADIYLVSKDGNELKQITNHIKDDVLPAISPTDDKIAFISSRDSIGRNLFVMDFNGNNIEQLTKNADYEESPSWSPDGKTILFTRQLKIENDTTHASNGEIFKMNILTKEVTRLTDKKGFDSGAKYSPNGEKIAFYGLENELFNIYLMNSDGTNLINLTNDSTECYSPSWSPDGNWIAYTGGNSENYEIWIINIHTREKRRITNSDDRDQNPAWKKS